MNAVHPTTLDSLVDELRAHPVNTNSFFLDFRDRRLTIGQLQDFVRQYHFFCFRFVKVLEGLLYRTPIDELDMRIQLTKTLHSELGSGISEQAHIRHLERFAQTLGLARSDLLHTQPCPEVQQYLGVLEGVFLQSNYLQALGAELAVEATALSEFRYFLPGLQKYPQFTSKDLTFFSMHLEEEAHHSDWLVDAVRNTARSPEDLDQVITGARETADAWDEFWKGMHRFVFREFQE